MTTTATARDPERATLAATLRHLIAERERKLLSEAEVLQRLRIGRTTWRRWLANGFAPKPAIHQGRVVRWSAAQIDSLLEGGAE